MIKVLVIVLSGVMGGPQFRSLQVAKKLREYNVETVFCSPIYEDDFQAILKKDGFKSYQAHFENLKFLDNPKNLLKNIYWFFNFPRAVKEILDIIKKEKIDVIHAQGLFAFQAVIASNLSGKPLVWHLISDLYPPLLVSLLRPVIQSAGDELIFASRKTVDFYIGKKHHKYNINVALGSVDTQRFNREKISPQKVSLLKQELGLKSNEKVIGCIGNINPAKGLEYFIKCAYEVKNEVDEQTKFLIVGQRVSGHEQYFSFLNNLIEKYELNNNVIFVEGTSTPEYYYALMDIFLLSSVNEGTPQVIYEAMSMKIPVVASDVGGISEQVEDCVTGILVEPRNSKAMADAIKSILENDLATTMGQKGRMKAKETFSLEQYTKKYYEIYMKAYKKE